MIKLTARQIKWGDTNSQEIRAVEATLKVALQFASNRLEELAKQKSEFWEEIAELHDLDLCNKDWTIKRIDGEFCVVEEEE